jgi:hypothetical protein
MDQTDFEKKEEEEEEEEEVAEKLHYVQGQLPCGLWNFWAGRFSKNVLVEPHGAVSLAWKDGYEGTRMKAKGKVVAVTETLTPGKPCIVWEVTIRGDCKTFWFKDPEGGLPKGFRSRDEEAAQHRHGPRVERELRDVEYRFTLDYHLGSKREKDISAAEAREQAARALAREDPELIKYTRANLEAPGFPFIVEEPLLSLAEQVDMEDMEDY